MLGSLVSRMGIDARRCGVLRKSRSIRKIQSGSISYAEFSKGIIDGGVTNYWAYLAGKRVMYMGRYGDFHVELFPGQKQGRVGKWEFIYRRGLRRNNFWTVCI